MLSGPISKPFNVLFADEVYISLSILDLDNQPSYVLMGTAQSVKWSYRWNLEPYYVVGDEEFFPSEIFRNNFVARGTLDTVILKKYSQVDQKLFALGSRLILERASYRRGARHFDNSYSNIMLEFYAYSKKNDRGYKFSRIIIESVDGGIETGEFAKESISFMAGRVEEA